MHVRFVVNAFPVVSETFLFNLVTGLEARGVTVSVVAIGESNARELYKDRIHEWSGRLDVVPLRGRAARLGATLRASLADPRRVTTGLASFGPVRASNALLRAHYLTLGDPDIIHFAYSGTAIAWSDAVTVVGRPRPKLVVSCRGTAEKVKPIVEPERAHKLRALFATVDRVHCVSADMMNGLLEFGLRAEQTFINPPSIDLATFRRPAPYDAADRVVWHIVSTGRLHFQKGYMYGLLALRELKRRGIRFRYEILGDGPDREMLTYVIHQLGLADDVVLRGRVSGTEVKDALARANVFLLSSLYEGIANAALEAMAMQLPVVVTDAGGMSEVITHGSDGMVVPRFEATALATALADVLASRPLRQQLSDRARETVERTFSLDTQLERFRDEYARLLTAP